MIFPFGLCRINMMQGQSLQDKNNRVPCKLTEASKNNIIKKDG